MLRTAFGKGNVQKRVQPGSSPCVSVRVQELVFDGSLVPEGSCRAVVGSHEATQAKVEFGVRAEVRTKAWPGRPRLPYFGRRRVHDAAASKGASSAAMTEPVMNAVIAAAMSRLRIMTTPKRRAMWCPTRDTGG